jgi:carbonic anhydrase/acetyltransferase-like protein (isoleucine patch superfamily)
VIRSFDGRTPRVHESAFVSEAAYVIGDVEIGPDCTVWPGAVIRADANAIRLERNVHIEDNAVLHAVQTPLLIGDTVVVGHGVILHCARIGNNVLVANNATVLEGAELGDFVVVDSNALVKARTIVLARSFVSGNPAQVLGETRPEQARRVQGGARLHLRTAALYKEAGLGSPAPAERPVT